MARGLFSVMRQIGREMERAERARQREAARQAKDEARIVKEFERAARLQEKEDRRDYIESRVEETESLNRRLGEQVDVLNGFLADGLGRWIGVNWRSLERSVDESGIPLPGRRPEEADFAVKVSVVEKFRPDWKARRAEKEQETQRHYRDALEAYLLELRTFEAERARRHADVREYNDQIGAMRDGYKGGDPDAVGFFYDEVFSKCEYPEGFPCEWQVGYQPESQHLILDFDLPTLDAIVPTAERYRYSKSTDEISEAKRSQKARQTLYASVVAQAVLRRLFEIFQTDKDGVVQVASVNAYVDDINPATGQRVRPCLISVRVPRQKFQEIDLANVNAVACLKHLNALVSRSPAELVPVRPIITMDMVDSRFVQESDVLGILDQRPNLMELSPSEFENLITNLFTKMGLETRLTQASRDGGVDCVAFDLRPVIGGKVIVQAKRYKNTVGVSAVRDLYGAMQHEQAAKGILVATSGYGSAAYEFANGKPIQLITGSELLSLLGEPAGVEARIMVPDSWKDPVFDT